MKTNIIIISMFLVMIAISSASKITETYQIDNCQSSKIDNQTIQTFDCLQIKFNSNGFFKIKGERALGFYFSGIYNGNPINKTTTDYTWLNATITNYSDRITINSSTTNSQIKMYFTAYNSTTKFAMNLTNVQAKNVTNLTTTYLITLQDGDYVIFNNKTYFLNETKKITNNLNNKTLRMQFSFNMFLNFSDLIESGFNITEIHIGNGSQYGYPNKKLMSISFTYGNKILQPNQSLLFDPSITDTGFTTSTIGFYTNTQATASGINLTSTASNGTFRRIIDAWNGSTDFNLSLPIYWYNATWNNTGNATYTDIDMNVSYCNVSEVYNTSGLVAWWKLNENTTASNGIIDYAGSNNLTATGAQFLNGTECYPSGDGCYNFTGAGGQYVAKGGAPTGLPSGSSARSMGVWFRTTNLEIAAALGGYGGAASSQNFQIASGATQWRVNVWAGDWLTGVAVTPYQDNKWHYIMTTYNGTLLTLYIDGLQKANTTGTAVNTALANVVIGEEIDLGGWAYLGFLDSFQIYNRVLSDDEIKWTYFHTKPDLCEADSYNTLTTSPAQLYGTLNRRLLMYDAILETTDSGYSPMLNYVEFGYAYTTSTPPNQKPMITLDNPINDYQTTSNSATIRFNVSDNETDTITSRLYINGVLNRTNTTNNATIEHNLTFTGENTWVYWNVTINDSFGTIYSATRRFMPNYDNTPCQAVSNINIMTATTTTILWNWTAVSCSDLISYEGYVYDTIAETNFSGWNTTNTNKSIAGLTAGQNYTIFIRTIDDAGLKSDYATDTESTLTGSGGLTYEEHIAILNILSCQQTGNFTDGSRCYAGKNYDFLGNIWVWLQNLIHNIWNYVGGRYINGEIP